jgi:predicted outer membrane repeat protein
MNPSRKGLAIAATSVLAAVCGAAVAIPPGVRVVNHAAPSGGNGQSWAAAYDDLQFALAEARANPSIEQIWVARGTYKPAPNGPVTGHESRTFELRSGLGVYGGFAGGEVQLSQRDWGTNITILSGDMGQGVRAWHVVTASGTNASAVLDGFVVTGGRATEESPRGPRGGGILIQNGTATVRHCTIRNNTAMIEGSAPLSSAQGGGVWGVGIFDRCVFENNSSYGDGGGVSGGGQFTDCLFRNNGALLNGGGFNGGGTFVRCEFRQNSAATMGLGGGAVAGGGQFTDCDFIMNTAPFDAGAVSGGGTFTRCLFFGNSADTGALGYGTFTLIDCHLEQNVGFFIGFYQANIVSRRSTFVGNDPFRDCSVDAENSTFRGTSSSLDELFASPRDTRLVNCLVRNNSTRAVVRMASARVLEIINCTIIHNSWPGEAAVLVAHPQATARVYNTILWNNGGSTQDDQIRREAGTLDVRFSNIQGWTGSLGGTGNFGWDPVFADTEGRLAPGSPSIDAGNSLLVPAGITTDRDGSPRFREDPGTPNNGVGSPPVDMGAFEFQGQTCYANCDRSTTPPALNIDDFMCFINLYAAGHPLANCDGSTTPPVLNVDDFTCFINRFAAGCP